MGIKAEERPEWEQGKRIHRIVQDHVSRKIVDNRLKHILYKFPIVEEVDFDERCKFEFEFNGYKIIGFLDGINLKNKRFLEIKSSDPVWSVGRFQKAIQRKIYALARPDLTNAVLITCSKRTANWHLHPAKIFKVPLTEQDRKEAREWITAGIKILESGNFKSDLVDGKCIDFRCYWGANCSFK